MAALSALKLESKLMQLLKENDTVFTKDLTKQLSPFSKTEISQVLYKFKRDGIVDKVSQSPAAWSLKGKDGPSTSQRFMDCQEITKSPRLEPTVEDMEELLIQYLKQQDKPLKVSVIASALNFPNVRKVTGVLYSLKKFNMVKSSRDGRALTWIINWNVVDKDEGQQSGDDPSVGAQDGEQAATASSDDDSEMPLLEGPSADAGDISENANGDTDMADDSAAHDAINIKQELNSSVSNQDSHSDGLNLTDTIAPADAIHVKREPDSCLMNEELSTITTQSTKIECVANASPSTIDSEKIEDVGNANSLVTMLSANTKDVADADSSAIAQLNNFEDVSNPDSSIMALSTPIENVANADSTSMTPPADSVEVENWDSNFQTAETKSKNSSAPSATSVSRTNMFYPNRGWSDNSEHDDVDDMDTDDHTDNDALASQIKDSILVCLAKTPSGRLLVKEIFKRVGGHRKKDVNRYLYSMEKNKLVERIQQIPPVWGLTTKGRDAAKNCQQTAPQVLFQKPRQPQGRSSNQLDERGIPMSPLTLIKQRQAWGPGETSEPPPRSSVIPQQSPVAAISGMETSRSSVSSPVVAPPKPPDLLSLKIAPSFGSNQTKVPPKLLQGIGRGLVISPAGNMSSSTFRANSAISGGMTMSSAARFGPQASIPGAGLSGLTGTNNGSNLSTGFSRSSNSAFPAPSTTANSQGSRTVPEQSKNVAISSLSRSVPSKAFVTPRPASSPARPSPLPKGPPPSPMELLKSNTVFAAHPSSGNKVNVSGFGRLNVSSSVSNSKSDSLANKVNAIGFGPLRVSPINSPNIDAVKNPFLSSVQRTPLLASSSDPVINVVENRSTNSPQNVLESGNIPQLDMSALSSDSFAALNKNPVSALMEYAQSRKMTATIEVRGQAGPSHNPKFRIAARVGNRLFQEIISRNKKDGRREAADVALRTLISEGQYQVAQTSKNNLVERVQKLGLKITFFDKMAAMAHHAFNTLVAMVPDSMSGRKVLAALVMKRSVEDEGEVVSVGTGNRCIEGIYLSLEGKTVNDSHAEIITRRGFIRFVYKNLLSHEPGSAESLFESQLSPRGKLVLKPGISFHLYISTAPCGDGALFSPTDVDNNPMSVEENMAHDPIFTSQIQGVLRTKVERGEGTIPIEPGFKGQTWDGILRGERLKTMSCSDKLCRWNILGMQGALLSYFLEPVYLGSLTLGYLYVHGHLSRAVCCRLDNKEPDIVPNLPNGYRVNHPKLGRVTAYDPPRETEKTTSVSMNWIVGDRKPEVTDGTKGCMDGKLQDNRVSQVSKLRLYSLFKEVCHKYNRTELLNFESYYQAKLGAEEFQEAKALMNTKFKKSFKSTWVSKPPEEEMFS